MISFDVKYKGIEAKISLDAEQPDQYASILYEIITDLRDEVRDAFSSEIKRQVGSLCGVFGHRLGERTTPVDLYVGLQQINRPGVMEVRISKGEEIVDGWSYWFPGDACS